MKMLRRNSGSSFTFSFKAGASPASKAVKLALAITEPSWGEQGISNPKNSQIAPTKDLNVLVDRLTALLLVRMVGWIQPEHTFKDLSTTTICKDLIAKKGSWPPIITQQVMDQVKLYVGRMLENYQRVPYHNLEHCYHVSISVNKVMDMILQPLSKYDENDLDNPPPDTFGFKDDPLMQFAMMFAALVHDVHHQGIPNRQLANEDDELAVLYNDTAIAEQNSLFFAFSELLKPRYKEFREAVFPQDTDYRRFRKAVVNLVLCTDIADPERSQLTKSKWKEAFGDPYETIERKVRRVMQQQQQQQTGPLGVTNGRSSLRSSRRMSTQSILSDMSSIDASRRSVQMPGSPEIMQALNDDSSVSLSPGEESDNEDDYNAEKDSDEEEEVELSKEDLKPITKQLDDKAMELASSNSGAAGITSSGGPVKVPSKAAQFQVYQVPLNPTGIPLSPKQTKTRKNRVRRMKSDQGGALLMAPRFGGLMMKQRRSNDSGDPSVASVEERRMAEMADKYRLRLSNDDGKCGDTKRRFMRLGLLRTVDLTGEQIDNYRAHQRRASAVAGVVPITKSVPPPKSAANGTADKTKTIEELNALRETVVMETILLACDVAHNLQGWEQMAKWSNKLYLELRKAHVSGRGADPTDGWYNNQIGFLEAYLLPLARRLDDTGVFGTERGAIFANTVLVNRERWGHEGASLTAAVIRKGLEQFPEDGSEWGDDWSC